MCWGRYFVPSWGETRCPWWERAAVSRAPGQAEMGLAMPGWAALRAPVGMCCSAGSISCCCTEPVMGIAASPRQGGARAFLLLSAQPRISQPTSPARHTMKLNSNVLQYPERMELLVSVQPCKVESSRCQAAFYSPDFKAGLISSTQAPRQLSDFPACFSWGQNGDFSYAAVMTHKQPQNLEKDKFKWFFFLQLQFFYSIVTRYLQNTRALVTEKELLGRHQLSHGWISL